MARMLLGDSRRILAAMDANSIDSIVCDPPYEISFMSKNWDSTGIAYDPTFWAECLRVLKPGGHMTAFGACRTYHRIACAIEDAGFEIRDGLQWLFGSGFPKSLDISKAIDKAAGAEHLREFKCANPADRPYTHDVGETSTGWQSPPPPDKTHPATPEAQQWDGWGTALKPAYEPIILARKPLAGTVAATVLEYGTGGLNVDGCRVPGEYASTWEKGTRPGGFGDVGAGSGSSSPNGEQHEAGRWPPNVLLSPETAAKLGDKAAYFPVFDYGDEDRFFYAPKASREEREAGCEHLPGKTQAETVDREPGAPGGNNPRAGAGRENGKESGVKVRNFHPT